MRIGNEMRDADGAAVLGTRTAAKLKDDDHHRWVVGGRFPPKKMEEKGKGQRGGGGGRVPTEYEQ